MKMNPYFIGLMSGTSVDAIDAGLWHIDNNQCQLVSKLEASIGPKIREHIIKLSTSGQCTLNEVGQLDTALGQLFANAVNELMTKSNINKSEVTAIGSHGQTLWHQPNGQFPFTMQVGDPNIISQQTKLPVIADFRRADMAHGGQGAPLAPAFHQWAFRSAEVNRAIVNIGGISNITYLDKNKRAKVLGYDTGPGNGLMDAWCEKHTLSPFDKDGVMASQGEVLLPLLNRLQKDAYFTKSFPKSTGKESFNLKWLEPFLSEKYLPEDVQATLLALTAHTISDAVKKHMSEGELYVCGGGAFNPVLMNALMELLSPTIQVDTTQSLGVCPNWVESACFAWLARQRILCHPIELSSITGATTNTCLGAAYMPTPIEVGKSLRFTQSL